MNLFLSILFLVSSISVYSQNNKSLLWRITGKNLKDTSYLFGTIHAIPRDRFFIPDSLMSSFSKCKNLVLETDLKSNVSDSIIKKELLIPDDQLIKDLYSQRDYEFLLKYFKDSLKGISNDILTIKPFWLSSFINSRILLNYESYESIFIQKAFEQKKTVLGLETTQNNLALINQIPLRQQSKMLLNAIKNRKKEELNYKEILRTYLAQDIDLLNTATRSQLRKYRKFYYYFFTIRNRAWIITIDKIITDQSSFIVVGAGHLGGTDGLILLLKKLGYHVDPLI